MDDIAKLLRSRPLYASSGEESDLPEMAADEIERLRSLLDAAEANATHWHTQCMQAREMAAAWEREARNLKEAETPVTSILAAAHAKTPAPPLHRVMGQPFQDFKEDRSDE